MKTFEQYVKEQEEAKKPCEYCDDDGKVPCRACKGTGGQGTVCGNCRGKGDVDCKCKTGEKY